MVIPTMKQNHPMNNLILILYHLQSQKIKSIKARMMVNKSHITLIYSNLLLNSFRMRPFLQMTWNKFQMISVRLVKSDKKLITENQYLLKRVLKTLQFKIYKSLIKNKVIRLKMMIMLSRNLQGRYNQIKKKSLKKYLFQVKIKKQVISQLLIFLNKSTKK